MCGSLQLAASEAAIELLVKAGKVLPRTYIDPTPRYDLPFSSHRFMRSERLEWWSSKLNPKEMFRVKLLGVTKFSERSRSGGLAWFGIPGGYHISAIIHRQRENNMFGLSILTREAGIPVGNTAIDELSRQVAKVHHRIPVLV